MENVKNTSVKMKRILKSSHDESVASVYADENVIELIISGLKSRRIFLFFFFDKWTAFSFDFSPGAVQLCTTA